MEETITCIDCGLEKDRDQFYDRKNNQSVSKSKRCKDCTKVLNRAYSGNNKWYGDRATTTEPGANAVIDLLRSIGVYAVNGKASEFRGADVVAWGCVRIEVKTSRKQTPQGWRFTFKGSQLTERLNSDIVVLLPDFDNTLSFHVFDADDPVLYYKNRVKSALYWNPNSQSMTRGNWYPLSTAIMNDHKDKWDLIEAHRQRVIAELLTSVKYLSA